MPNQLHLLNFIPLHSSPITSLSLTPTSVQPPLLAVGRDDGRIEVYRVCDQEVVLDRIIPGEKGDKITKLLWSSSSSPSTSSSSSSLPRLFSSSLSSLLIEWDLSTLKPKQYSQSYGGGIWCMELQPKNNNQHKEGEVLAIGCEDGGIRLFDISEGKLELWKALPNKMRRILSLAWFPDGKYLVTGNDATTIEKWDVELGKVVLTMNVEYGANWKTTPIWDLVIASGNTIASGDGKGNLTLFDGEFGTMLTTFRSHEVDILCLAVNKAGTEIYSAGVDNKINRYVLNKLSSASDWSIQSHRRHHFHDTKSLVLFENHEFTRLFSGGMDMRLSSVYTNKFISAHINSLPAFPRPSPISLAPGRKLIMATFPDRAKIWSLGSTIDYTAASRLEAGTCLPINVDYKEQLTILTESTHNSLSGTISPDGNWVALADIDQLRLFNITWPDEQDQPPSLSLVPNFPPKEFYSACFNKCHSAKELLFVKNELMVATTSGQVFALSLNPEGAKVRELSPFSKSEVKNQVITSLKSNPLGSHLLVSLSNNKQSVINVASGESVFKLEFEPLGSIQALLLDSPIRVAAIDSNWTVLHYGLDSHQPISISEPIDSRYASSPTPCLTSDNRVVLYDSKYIVQPGMNASGAPPKPLVPHPYKDIMFMACLSQDQLVIVERPYEEILARLPPAFASKLYTGETKGSSSTTRKV